MIDTPPSDITGKELIETLVALLQQKGVTYLDMTWEVGRAKEIVSMRIQLLADQRPEKLS